MGAAWYSAAVLLAVMATDLPGITVRFEPETPEAGTPFLLIVEAAGTRVKDPVIPDIRGINVDRRVFRREDRITVGGSGTAQVAVRGYRALASQPGSFTIPPVSVIIDGNTLHSEPLILTVTHATSLGPSASASSALAPKLGEEIAWDDAVFISSEVNKRVVYEGEAVELTLGLWAHESVTVSERPMAAHYPATPGFYAVPQAPEPAGFSSAARGGIPFRVSRMKQVLYPLRTGTLTIGPWEWSGVARARTDQGFDRKSVHRTAEPIEIEARPLPSRPSGFSGAVGSFSIRAALTSTATEQGTPVQLVVSVAGNGNPDAIGAPQLPDLTGVHIGDPEIETTAYPVRDPAAATFERSFTYAVTPALAGVVSIPPIAFCYFDPSSESYLTIQTEPVTLTVTPPQSPAVAATASDGGSDNPAGSSGHLVRGLLPRPARLRRGSSGIPGGVFTLVLPPLIYGVFVLTAARNGRRGKGANGVRSASIMAHNRLADAVQSGEPAHVIFHAMAEFAAASAGFSSVGLTSGEIEHALVRHGVPPDLASRYVRILRRCEQVQYARTPLAPEETRALVQGAAMAVAQLDERNAPA